MNIIFKITFFKICLFVFTVQAFALAGLAEFDYDLIYNKYADIYLGIQAMPARVLIDHNHVFF